MMRMKRMDSGDGREASPRSRAACFPRGATWGVLTFAPSTSSARLRLPVPAGCGTAARPPAFRVFEDMAEGLRA